MDWDLTPLSATMEDKDTQPHFDALEAKVQEIEALKPRLDELSQKELEAALHTLGAMREIARRLSYRGMLTFSVDTTDDEAKTFMERTRAVTTEAANRTRFLSHWLKDLSEERAAALKPTDPELAYYVHTVRLTKPYTLSQEIEEVISDKDMAGASAIRQAREIVSSQWTFEHPETGEPTTQSEVIRFVHSPVRELRHKAYASLFKVFEANESILAHLYRSVVRDWQVENLKHREYPQAMTPMNMANEVSDEVVTTMLDRCIAGRDVWQDYFAWKATEIGGPFDRRDIYAPIEAATLEVPYDDAVATVLAVFEGFHPRYAELAKRVFDERHVDPFPGKTKRGGAFCATPTTDMTPYVLLNHTDDARSVSTMAHELGHAIHSMLSADRHPLVSSAPLPLAETASVFSELLLHHHLVAEHPEAVTAVTNERVADLYATIGRQAYFARFEMAAHTMIAAGEPTAKVHEHYMGMLKEQFGTLEVPEPFAKEWLMIPHFVASPFYVSSYSFGALLSLSLYKRYQEDASFAETVIRVLSAGGSREPEALLAEHGIDITSGAFWDGGLDVVREMVGALNNTS